MAATARKGRQANTDADTRTRILDAAEELVQLRGFNAFSYADVAERVGITKASLHYHFAGKADLGEALIARYSERFATALALIGETELDALGRLRAYVELYAAVLRRGRMCLCGMLAAEHETLAQEIRERVLAFLDANESWLASVLEEGRAAGSLEFAAPAAAVAQSLLGGLEGAMLIARSYGDVQRFEASAAALLDGLTGKVETVR